MHRIFIAFFLTILFFGINIHAQAGNEIEVVDFEVSHTFGEQISIHGMIQTEGDIRELTVVIQSEDNTIIASNPVILTADEEVYYTLDLSRNPIRAFSLLYIWFDVVFEDGSLESSQQLTYFYDDNRFEWQVLKTDEFHIFWYDGDPNLGRNISKAAYDGTILIRNILEIPYTDAIEIYAYASALELQDTLMFSGQSAAWVAGHADPDLKVIVVSLPDGPEQAFEIKRQIPHELMHVMLYQKLGSSYANLPRWLNEGLASIVELFPNPDYQLLLDKAYERQVLMPISDLCNSFPIDAANFQLAYAESTAFTRYLQQIYGNEKLDSLVQTYADGQGCLQSIEIVFGASLPELEMHWRQAMFHEDASQITWGDTFPIFIILGMAMLTPFSMMILNGGRKPKNSTSLDQK